ncbi:hypothetical protein ZIOFF_011626 [Zingiber officinale]|uniref:Symplekin/Pta1 N-terminal domain-containing protein n=1 Tax=Zingiber officinale TaxID=94328 RepID=A0A8J5LTB3_ZINOF|nr:hypothetical protein ZIOFF_011626 [Zingiber officinale]
MESPAELVLLVPVFMGILYIAIKLAASYTFLIDPATGFKAILVARRLSYFPWLLKDLGSKVSEKLIALMPNLLTTLRHQDLFVVKQSISCGTALFGAVLEEIALQFHMIIVTVFGHGSFSIAEPAVVFIFCSLLDCNLHGSGKIEQWLEELWSWMVKFMESVSAILMEPGSNGIKVPALKFIETCILYFTPAEDRGVFSTQGKFMRFNVSHLPINNSILNPAALEIEADRALNFLLDVLQSATTFRGSFVIAVINT